MTEAELVKLLSEPFYENYAGTVATRICDANAFNILYTVVTSGQDALAGSIKHKVLFRGAYVLERIYFDSPSLFMPYAASFCADFSACADASAQRHFAKIMAHLLHSYTPSQPCLEQIADSAALWAVEPKTKVAVRIWAVEVLKCCRNRVGWVADSWEDLVEAMAHDATPAILCRLRKSWKKLPDR